MAHRQPVPGRPVRRDGKVYIWATWLAKALGGSDCLFSPWFKAHFRYAKYELEGEQLADWNRDHTALMREIREELEENGWRVRVENENELRLEGETAIVAGKPDIIATMPGHVLVVDGKTGRHRESDWWQVFIYLFGIQKTRPDLTGDLEAEVRYKAGAPVLLRPDEMTAERLEDFVRMVKTLATETAPPKRPSRFECQRCNIHPLDCPERFQETKSVAGVPAAVGF